MKKIDFGKYRQPGWDGVLVSVCAHCGEIYGAKDAQGSGDHLSHGACPRCHARELAAMDGITIVAGPTRGRPPVHGFSEYAVGESRFTPSDNEPAQETKHRLDAALRSRRMFHQGYDEEWTTQLAEKNGQSGVLVTRVG